MTFAMFVGSINQKARTFLAHNAHVFSSANVVVGCSGNFTFEAAIRSTSSPASVHSNDVSLYSSVLGCWLAGRELDYEVVDPEFSWLKAYMTTPEERVAVIMVFFDMLQYEKRNNEHRLRMWHQYERAFPGLVAETVEKLRAIPWRVDSYYIGDVMAHFERFSDDDNAIFCAFAPTYTGGYERQYRRMEEIFAWDAPVYPLLDEGRRNALFAWMRERKYLWYDDRYFDTVEPVYKQISTGRRTVWLYSNVVSSAGLFTGRQPRELPRWPVAGSSFRFTEDTKISLKQISTSDLLGYKDAYLSKNITRASGTWAFAVLADSRIIGFLEFASSNASGDPDALYMMSDFCVPGTRYRRLSKLIVMLARSRDVQQRLRRLKQYPATRFYTTAFTDKPVSMKYRGVMKLLKRGKRPDTGQKFLNYGAEFTDASLQEVYLQWLKKHGSKMR